MPHDYDEEEGLETARGLLPDEMEGPKVPPPPEESAGPSPSSMATAEALLVAVEAKDAAAIATILDSLRE